jgi:glucosamine 6-phosphate synthetase-like amidotransferase/phosphosugar isomerase protein
MLVLLVLGLHRDDTCVFVSQSGETADTLRALEYAKVGLVCCQHSMSRRDPNLVHLCMACATSQHTAYPCNLQPTVPKRASGWQE